MNTQVWTNTKYRLAICRIPLNLLRALRIPVLFCHLERGSTRRSESKDPRLFLNSSTNSSEFLAGPTTRIRPMRRGRKRTRDPNTPCRP